VSVPIDLLRRIDAYLDAAPRTGATGEPVGPFTLFVNGGGGWRYYARPTPGARPVTPEDVVAVRERQRALGQPEAIEWVLDVSPGVGAAAGAAGMQVAERPLMHLATPDFRAAQTPHGGMVRVLDPNEDPAIAMAVAELGFASEGTDPGPVGYRPARILAARLERGALEFVGDRLRRGLTVTALATSGGEPAAVGSHQPLHDMSEIVGVTTLPAFRRRGLGAAVTSVLVRDALERGADTVFLTAGNEEIARVYERVGFRTIGRVGVATAPD
jgi:ribosomal protein S18 acetylase RimI-like enzyme